MVEQGRPWSFDGDGHLFRLVSEAHRIRLAHLFDPLLAVHTSLIEPLPHQITAVYEAMLPRQPLRFLLADDPGAGKTIMAGLLITSFGATRLRMEMDRVPVEIIALQPPDEGEQLGLDLLVLGCLHDRPERSFSERLDDAHERPNRRTVVSEIITMA